MKKWNKLLKEQIRQLQLEENAIMNNLNKTKNRYDIYTSNDKYGVLGYKNRDGENSYRATKRKSSFN